MNYDHVNGTEAPVLVIGEHEIAGLELLRSPYSAGGTNAERARAALHILAAHPESTIDLRFMFGGSIPESSIFLLRRPHHAGQVSAEDHLAMFTSLLGDNVATKTLGRAEIRDAISQTRAKSSFVTQRTIDRVSTPGGVHPNFIATDLGGDMPPNLRGLMELFNDSTHRTTVAIAFTPVNYGDTLSRWAQHYAIRAQESAAPIAYSLMNTTMSPQWEFLAQVAAAKWGSLANGFDDGCFNARIAISSERELSTPEVQQALSLLNSSAPSGPRFTVALAVDPEVANHDLHAVRPESSQGATTAQMPDALPFISTCLTTAEAAKFFQFHLPPAWTRRSRPATGGYDVALSYSGADLEQFGDLIQRFREGLSSNDLAVFDYRKDETPGADLWAKIAAIYGADGARVVVPLITDKYRHFALADGPLHAETGVIGTRHFRRQDGSIFPLALDGTTSAPPSIGLHAIFGSLNETTLHEYVSSITAIVRPPNSTHITHKTSE